MRHFLFLMIATLTMLAACSQTGQQETLNSQQQYTVSDDSTIYGLTCDGTNDTIVVFLSDPYYGSDPDTLNILKAISEGRIFGTMHTGDRLAIMRDSADTTSASSVIVTQNLLGLWAYKVKPTLRRHIPTDSTLQDPISGISADSLRKLLAEEREYGISLNPDSVMFPFGFRRSANDESSPVQYPAMKRYRQWCIYNGRLLFTATNLDTLGNKPAETDTVELVRLTEDTLVLRFKDGEYGYYRKENRDS